MSPLVISLLCTILAIVRPSLSLALRETIYVDLSADHPCTRLFNATHQVGCHSSKRGNVGTVFWAKNIEDVKSIPKLPSNIGPYVLVVDIFVFKQLDAALYGEVQPHLVGMIVYYNESSTVGPETGYSDDETCPSSRLDLYATSEKYGHCKVNKWNPPATGTRFIDWQIPIFLVTNSTEISYLTQQCYEKHNKDLAKADNDANRICAAQLTIFNHGAGDTVRCMRRSYMWRILDPPIFYCIPMQGVNLFSMLPHNSSEPSANSTFVLASRIDSISTFTGYNPGATTLGSIITWLVIVEAVGRNMDVVKKLSAKYNRHFLPVLFHGESFDYIGSSRFVYDLQHGSMTLANHQDISLNFNLTHIGTFMELSQLTNVHEDELFVHYDPDSYKTQKGEIERMYSTLKKLLEKTTKLSKVDGPLPPSSLQTFLKANLQIPGIVLGDYNTKFGSKYYNSFMDTPLFVNIGKFKKVAYNVASSTLTLIFQWLNNDVEYAVPNVINRTKVDVLTDCFMQWPQWNCSLFERMTNSLSGEARKGYASMLHNNSRERTSIHGRGRFNTPGTMLLPMLIEFFLGVVSCTDKIVEDACVNLTEPSANCYTSLNLFTDDNQTCCVCSLLTAGLAKSPVFDMNGVKSELLNSGYSTWVESLYSVTKIRIFLQTHPRWQMDILLSGVGVFVASLLFVTLVTNFSKELFDSQVSVAL